MLPKYQVLDPRSTFPGPRSKSVILFVKTGFRSALLIKPHTAELIQGNEEIFLHSRPKINNKGQEKPRLATEDSEDT
jgi:hypothetical protein